HERRFKERVFTGAACEYAAGKGCTASYLAARWAAKEAAAKALGLGLGQFCWREIEIAVTPGGQPTLRLSGQMANLAARLGITRWHVSLTHDRSRALAQVVAEKG
ncbi:MAG: holo-ACP synthase, partial [Clostridia bacterium]|nr:holo-ACP synthase [Clostridia bacterium]